MKHSSRFEYKVLRTNSINIEDEINNESKNGWRFVQMECIGTGDICAVLEREVKSKQ